MSVDEVAGQHHRCNEQELGQTLGDGERQGGLLCCGTWGLNACNKVQYSYRSIVKLITVTTELKLS